MARIDMYDGEGDLFSFLSEDLNDQDIQILTEIQEEKDRTFSRKGRTDRIEIHCDDGIVWTWDRQC